VTLARGSLQEARSAVLVETKEGNIGNDFCTLLSNFTKKKGRSVIAAGEKEARDVGAPTLKHGGRLVAPRDAEVGGEEEGAPISPACRRREWVRLVCERPSVDAL